MQMVIALDLVLSRALRRASFTGIARAFAPHVTLRGRFTAASEWNATNVARSLRDDLPSTAPTMTFSGPIEIGNNMIWLECLPSDAGFDFLQSCHERIEFRLRQMGAITEDHVPISHQGPGYRPHITLAWGKIAVHKLGDLLHSNLGKYSASPHAYTIYQYERTPADSSVDRIYLKAASR